MPFHARTFRKQIEDHLTGDTRDALLGACQEYASSKTPAQKAGCIREMMLALDRSANEETRRNIMEACGRECIGGSVLKKAQQIQRSAENLDDLLQRLNEAHIGGGSLHLEGNIIHASYTRCYCGSVSQARQPISATYCACSCGWFRQLFEILLGRPVEVWLASSIIQGDDRCRFVVDIGESGRFSSEL